MKKIGFVLFGLGFFLSLGFFVIVIFVWVYWVIYVDWDCLYIECFYFWGVCVVWGVRDILNARAIYLQIEEAWA